jgi:hypothetical protein
MIAVLAFMSYMTVTFMVEAMAAANAFMRRNEIKKSQNQEGSVQTDKTPLLNARTLGRHLFLDRQQHMFFRRGERLGVFYRDPS